jgi:hypothetical protein
VGLPDLGHPTTADPPLEPVSPEQPSLRLASFAHRIIERDGGARQDPHPALVEYNVVATTTGEW